MCQCNIAYNSNLKASVIASFHSAQGRAALCAKVGSLVFYLITGSLKHLLDIKVGYAGLDFSIEILLATLMRLSNLFFLTKVNFQPSNKAKHDSN